ncbi:hypothetical protein [Natronorarus salvus]|uniref:hypothetical protein n=1 Tax=Natronorarus salvus TaxID=3117733 RepID=UPI002F26757A
MLPPIETTPVDLDRIAVTDVEITHRGRMKASLAQIGVQGVERFDPEFDALTVTHTPIELFASPNCIPRYVAASNPASRYQKRS